MAAPDVMLYNPGSGTGLEVALRKLVIGLAVAGALSVSAFAQDNRFGGFKHDRTAPIDVTADAVEVRQAEERAILTGNVVAGQGTLRLTASKVTVDFDQEKQSNDETGAITRLEAVGDVFLSNGAETAQSGWAEYNLETGIVKMRNNVILTQGDNASKGEALTIDLNSGVARLEGGPKGRVSMTFRASNAGGSSSPAVCNEEQRRAAEALGILCIPIPKDASN